VIFFLFALFVGLNISAHNFQIFNILRRYKKAQKTVLISQKTVLISQKTVLISQKTVLISETAFKKQF
jgi:hypothetical protein